MGRHSIPGPDDFSEESIGGSTQSRPDDADQFDDTFPDPAQYLRQRSYADDGDYPDDSDDSDDDADNHQQTLFEIGPDGSPREARDGRRWQIGEQWPGGHRSEGGRRGVSVGVIAALVAVIVVVSTVIGWRFFGSSLSHRFDVAAGRCVAGDLAVPVIADPAIADNIQEFADRFNKSAKPVGDRCVSVRVKPADSDAVIGGFIGDWPAQLGDRPALWVAGSSISTARLQASIGHEAVSDARSLVTSPVLLAVRPELKPALAKQTWATLPDLQANPDSLGQLKLPGWGSLRLALPVAGNSDAAFLASEAVAVASTPPGAPASAAAAALRTLAGAQPRLADNSLAEAMNTLLRQQDPADASVHAVVTTEQQLFTRGKSLSDASSLLGSWLPPGPVPVADYPAVLLSGSWLSPEQISAASEFARFAHKPDQLADLAKAGFRADGVTPPSSDVTRFADLPAKLSVGDDALRLTLASVLTTPVGNSTVTIMLDRSMSTDEGGKSRLANVVAALNHRIGGLPPGSAVGLWTFDGVEGHPVLSPAALDDPVNGQPRADALGAELNGISPAPGGSVSFTTLRRVYTDALANYRPGQSNSVLVITAGPHTDQTLDATGLQDFIRQAVNPDRPVAVDVIDFGGDPDQPTWQAVAQLSGGSYQHLASSASPELATAVSTLLG